MKKYPNVSVKIIFKYKNKVLMLRQRNGKFDFPGGRIEWGESPLEALNRELKEELNYSLRKEPQLFSVWSYISKNKRRHTILIDYIYQLDKKSKFFSPEKAEPLWLNKKELMRIIKDKKFVKKIFDFRLKRKK